MEPVDSSPALHFASIFHSYGTTPSKPSWKCQLGHISKNACQLYQAVVSWLATFLHFKVTRNWLFGAHFRWLFGDFLAIFLDDFLATVWRLAGNFFGDFTVILLATLWRFFWVTLWWLLAVVTSWRLLFCDFLTTFWELFGDLFGEFLPRFDHFMVPFSSIFSSTCGNATCTNHLTG